VFLVLVVEGVGGGGGGFEERPLLLAPSTSTPTPRCAREDSRLFNIRNMGKRPRADKVRVEPRAVHCDNGACQLQSLRSIIALHQHYLSRC
jgi:hypothetical protein